MGDSMSKSSETNVEILGERWSVTPDTDINLISFRLFRRQFNHILAEGYSSDNMAVISDE